MPAKTKRAPVRRATSPTRARREAAKRRRERRFLAARMVVAGLILLFAGFAIFEAATSGNGAPAAAPACHEDAKFDPSPAGSPVVANPQYKITPPDGGAYTADAARPGFYRDQDVPPTDGALVHAQARGFVVLWYRAGLGDPAATAVDALSNRFGRVLIVVPRRSIPVPVVVTAWHHRLICGQVDVKAITSFTNAHKAKGPEKGFL